MARSAIAFARSASPIALFIVGFFHGSIKSLYVTKVAKMRVKSRAFAVKTFEHIKICFNRVVWCIFAPQ